MENNLRVKQQVASEIDRLANFVTALYTSTLCLIKFELVRKNLRCFVIDTSDIDIIPIESVR